MADTENISELAYLVCDFGSLVGILRASNHGSVTANDEHEATVDDDAPGLNIPPFGTCSAVGTCNYVPFGGWTNWVQSTSGNNRNVLTLDSRLSCTNGGQIEAFNSAESLEAALEERPEVSVGTADRLSALSGLPELFAADFWMSNPTLMDQMTPGLGFAQTAMGTPIGQVYNDDQNDAIDRAHDFTESRWGTAFSSYGVGNGLWSAASGFGRLGAIAAWDRRVRFEQDLLRNAVRVQSDYDRALRLHRRHPHARWRTLGHPAASQVARSRAAMARAGIDIWDDTPRPPRPSPKPPVSRFRWVRIGGRLTRVLGPVGMGLDGMEARDRARDGDIAGSRRSWGKVVAGGLMTTPNPYAIAAGAYMYGGIMVYEHGYPHVENYLSDVETELNIGFEARIRQQLGL